MKIVVLYLFALFFQINSFGQSIDQVIAKLKDHCKKGYIPSLEDSAGEILEVPISRGGSVLPPSFSIKSHVPKVQEQEGGSCVSFASAYYGLTTYERIIRDNDSLMPFDPMYLHGRMLSFFNECNNINHGSFISLALTMLCDYGCPLSANYSDFKYCDYQDPLAVHSEKLISWKKLSNSITQIDKIKYALSEGKPIISGISTNLSMMVYLDDFLFFSALINDSERKSIIKFIRESVPEECNGYTDSEIINEFKKLSQINTDEDLCWSGKYPLKGQGGHAICIVGYDDTKFGGAFEIVNSWGESWGKDGFIWIKYKDIYKMFPTFFMIGN
jgi:hypothetical protein